MMKTTFLAAILLMGLMGPVHAADLTPAEARSIAKEAYIYGFPMVDSYRIQHAYFIDERSPEYKAPWNHIRNIPRVYTPADKAVQTPNSDTPYSMLGADLRAEPLVLSVPSIEEGRYYSLQFIDAYTFNFAYVGSRATGNKGDNYLLAGPAWQGNKPEGIDQVIQSETEIVLVAYRTQLFQPDDLDNVKKIQEGYTVVPLSQFLGTEPAPPAPALTYPNPLSVEEQRRSPEFFGLLNFVLGFCPPHPSEKDLRERFATLGIEAGKDFDPTSLSPELRDAIQAGIADAWEEMGALKKRADAGEVSSGDLFGTREKLQNNYLRRMLGAVVGIYANTKEEAMYPFMPLDADGDPLDGAKHAYTLRFAAGQLPPANAFWSLTMYRLPESILVENPINRYLINAPMLPELKRDADGSLTILLQADQPAGELQANWLPAPKGPFFVVLRIYWPKEEALTGAWKVPAIQKAP